MHILGEPHDLLLLLLLILATDPFGALFQRDAAGVMTAIPQG